MHSKMGTQRNEVRRPGRRTGRPVAMFAAVLVALLGVAAGCKDELAAPTQGFIAVETGGVSEVTVYLDGEAYGVDVDRVGPLDAGTYLVRVERDGFGVDPAAGVTVAVAPATTASARFTLVAEEFGDVRIRAEDELTATEILGAAILQDDGTGTFVSTGTVTGQVLADLPIGSATFLVRMDGFEDSAPFTIDILDDTEVSRDVVLGPLHAVLGEMFTYLTCPNCPDAAEALKNQHEGRHGRAFVIEWHTIAPLPMYDARWVAREAFYEDLAGAPLAVYPSTLFQGELPWIEGGGAADTSQYAGRYEEELAVCGGACPVAMSGEAVIPGSGGVASADVTGNVKWRGGTIPGDLVLRVVLLGNGIPFLGIEFDFVAHDLVEIPISFSSPGEVVPFTAELSTPSPTYTVSDWSWVAFVQSDATGEVLAVCGTY